MRRGERRVYLLHFHKQLPEHAFRHWSTTPGCTKDRQHYVGWTRNIHYRLKEHAGAVAPRYGSRPGGSYATKIAYEEGIGFDHVYLSEPMQGPRNYEERLLFAKINDYGPAIFCPLCT